MKSVDDLMSACLDFSKVSVSGQRRVSVRRYMYSGRGLEDLALKEGEPIYETCLSDACDNDGVSWHHRGFGRTLEKSLAALLRACARRAKEDLRRCRAEHESSGLQLKVLEAEIKAILGPDEPL